MMPVIRHLNIPEQPETEYREEQKRFAEMQEDLRAQTRALRRAQLFGWFSHVRDAAALPAKRKPSAAKGLGPQGECF